MPGLSVKRRADAVGVLRYVNVFLMETLAAWVPSVPEMEAKVLFGRHIWRVAQSADAFGLRTRELRAPLHYSVAPPQSCLLAFETGAALRSTDERIAGYHDLLLGALGAGYAWYLGQTDRLVDEPSVVLVESGLREIDVMRTESARLLEDFPGLRLDSPGKLDDLRRALAACGGILRNDLEEERNAATAG